MSTPMRWCATAGSRSRSSKLAGMSSPYRDTGVPEADVAATSDEPKPLASYDVSGAKGADGAHGYNGSPGVGSGCDGAPGGHAGPSMPGETAGQIRLQMVSDDAAG